jgi:hypothetical protein
LKQGWTTLCDRINLPFASSIRLPTNSQQTSSSIPVHHLSSEFQLNLVIAATANVIAAQLRPLSTNSHEPNPRPFDSRVVTLLKSSRSAYTDTLQCLPPPPPSPRPPAPSSSLRVESAAASALMTAVAAASPAPSCKRYEPINSHEWLRSPAAHARAKAETDGHAPGHWER